MTNTRVHGCCTGATQQDKHSPRAVALCKIPFLLTLTQLIISEKEKKQNFQKAASGGIFLNPQAVGTGSPKGVQDTLLHLPAAPLGTLQQYRVLYSPATSEDRGKDGLQMRLQGW